MRAVGTLPLPQSTPAHLPCPFTGSTGFTAVPFGLALVLLPCVQPPFWGEKGKRRGNCNLQRLCQACGMK